MSFVVGIILCRYTAVFHLSYKLDVSQQVLLSQGTDEFLVLLVLIIYVYFLIRMTVSMIGEKPDTKYCIEIKKCRDWKFLLLYM